MNKYTNKTNIVILNYNNAEDTIASTLPAL